MLKDEIKIKKKYIRKKILQLKVLYVMGSIVKNP
jgi:hypothetical protein